MRKSIISIVSLCIVALSCNKSDSVNSGTSTTTATLSSISLSPSTFTNSGTAQAATLTVTIANATAANVSFSITSSASDFTPTTYSTAVTAGQTSVAIPVSFDGSSTVTTETITVSANTYNGTPTTTATIGTSSSTYNDLWIPPTITGTTFNLSLAKSTKQFKTGAVTNTYGYNGNQFWGPTLIMNKGDNVQMNVTNTLTDSTTVHWHGFHIPAVMDGGPHQVIAPNKTWSPYFTIKNNAGLYWYHPHLHEKTFQQLSLGAGGFIIIKDPQETALALPRTYGVDDIPLVFSSRRFLSSNQFSTNIALDPYGDYMLANGVMNAQVSMPKQYVRLRILNAEMQRGLNIGFSDNRTFYVIGNDGGLVNAPVAVTRVILVPGERIEVMVNLGSDAVGSSLDLKAYNSGQTFGFPGNEGNPVQPTGNAGPAFQSLLNNTDFTLLHINVAATTTATTPITAVPSTLANNTYWTLADVTNSRTITVTGGQAGSAFSFDNNYYDSVKINQIIALNAIEKWTIVNNDIFGHALHIHDIQFKIISRSSGAVAAYEQGWKDVVYLKLGETVQVIAKFDDFSSSVNPYMYHCHFSNHEDEGMMGQFLVK